MRISRAGLSTGMPGLFLVLVAIAPSGMMFVTGEATFSWGALSISLFLIASSFFVDKHRFLEQAKNYRSFRFVLIFLLLHGLLCTMFIGGFSESRFFLSYVLLMIVVLSGLCLSVLLASNSDQAVGSAIGICYWTLVVIGAIGLMGTLRSFGDTKTVVVFTEPAHFAATFVPFAIYMAVTGTLRSSMLYIGICLVFGILFPSTTFLAVGFLTFIIAFRKSRIFLFIAICLTFIVWLNAGNILGDYHQERLDFGGENLSSLVYRSGWERAADNITETIGLGLGFQQLGITGSVGHSLDEIAYITQGSDLNALDGGSIGAKVISEFGAAGILVLILWFIYAVKSLITLNVLIANRSREPCNMQIFCHAIFIGIGISLFVRGSGYFSAPALLFFMSAWTLRFNRTIPRRVIGQPVVIR